ncbi:hypothetical protein D3C78_1447480 [compost metagenome]
MVSDKAAYTTAPIPKTSPAKVACQETIVADILKSFAISTETILNEPSMTKHNKNNSNRTGTAFFILYS